MIPFRRWRGFALGLLFACPASGIAEPGAALERLRVVVLPLETEQESFKRVNDRAAELLVERLVGLKRFDVIDRSALEKILKEQQLALSGLIDESKAIQAGRISQSQIGFIVKVVGMEQSVIQREEEVEGAAQETMDKGRHHERKTTTAVVKRTVTEGYQTDITVSVKKVDLETSGVLEALLVHGVHRGDDRNTSLEKAMANLADQFDLTLRRLFRLEMQIAYVSGGMVQGRAGDAVGVFPGTQFIVVRREQVNRGIHQGTVEREIGLVQVREVTASTCEATALRQFDEFKVGDVLRENLSSGMTVAVLGGTRQPDQWFGAGQFEARSAQDLSFGGSLALGSMRDNQAAGVWSLQLDVFGRWRPIQWGRLVAVMEAGLGILVGAQRDDAGASASALVVPVFAGPGLEWIVNKDASLFVQSRYVLSSKLNQWDVVTGSGRSPATWTGRPAPEADPNGWQVFLGLKWAFF